MIFMRFIAGAALLTLGRKLFWLFVAAVGFIWAMNLAVIYFPNQPDGLVIVIAIAAGIAGALIAISVRWLGIGLGGFLGGAQIAASLLSLFGFDLGRLTWLGWLVGGILGAILFVAIFDWALIVLSSVSGALILVDLMPLAPAVAFFVFLVIMLGGVAIQARMLQDDRRGG